MLLGWFYPVLVTIGFCLERAFFVYTYVVGLCLCELGEVYTYALEM